MTSLLFPIWDASPSQTHIQQYAVGWHAWQAFEEEEEGKAGDFEIKVLDNETVKLEPRLHKVVIGKNYFQLSSYSDALDFPFQ